MRIKVRASLVDQQIQLLVYLQGDQFGGFHDLRIDCAEQRQTGKDASPNVQLAPVRGHYCHVHCARSCANNRIIIVHTRIFHSFSIFFIGKIFSLHYGFW